MLDPLLPAKAPLVRDHITAPISHYQRGDVLFSSPEHTLLARGGPTLTGVALPELPAAVADRLARHDAPGTAMVIGAISFDGQNCRLKLPARLKTYPPLPLQRRFHCGTSAWTLTSTPSSDDYAKLVGLARDRIAVGEADKVVLARALTATSSQPIRLTTLLLHLGGRGRHTFAVPVGPRQTLLGASPELLISRRGRTLATTPLAGSIPRRRHPDDDQDAARALLASAKDRHEHQLVVRAVVAALSPYCAELNVPDEPEVQATPTLWHLASPITARLADPDVTALDLAAVLHPTPAVCGTPTTAARALIADLEGSSGLERGWYAGLVGWQRADGDGQWALALRCAVTDGDRRLRLWAGAGIVADSDPDLEVVETDAKLATMLHALDAIPR
ncbi:isochorismate synthase [Nonomuraea wenchangensis]|uniref:isochorismate synthase n=1 Tax=Nonomuraea wenchangensis TaxID=568860 RepID=UPI0034306B4F